MKLSVWISQRVNQQAALAAVTEFGNRHPDLIQNGDIDLDFANQAVLAIELLQLYTAALQTNPYHNV